MLESNRVYGALLNQPLFKYGVRRIRWGETVERLRKYNLRAAIIVHALLIGLWLLLVISSSNAYASNITGSYSYGSHSILADSGSFIGIVMVISILMNFILDFASLVFALNSIGGELSTGRWDLLRMTPMQEEHIVNSKHGLAQVRAWRVMAVVLYMRVAVVVLILLHLFLLPVLVGAPSPFADMFRYEFFAPFMALVIGVIFLAVYVIEPIWRMRAMTAVGVAVSARVHNIVFGLLTSFAAIVTTWIVQAIIMGILAWLTVQFLIGVTTSSSLIACSLLMACVTTAWIIRVFYVGLEGWALGYATRRIYRESQ